MSAENQVEAHLAAAAYHRAEADRLAERARRSEEQSRRVMPLLWGFIALLDAFLAVASDDIASRAVYLFATLCSTILACHWRWGRFWWSG